MNIDYKGINETVITCLVDESVEVGSFVKMQSSYKVRRSQNGEDFMGVCLSVRDGYGAIQIGGYYEAKSLRALPTGLATLVADENNCVSTGEGNLTHLVVCSDETKTGFFI